MKRTSNVILSLALSILLGTSIGYGAKKAPNKESKALEYKEGEVLIKFKADRGPQAASLSHARLGSHVSKRFRRTGIQLARLRYGLTTKEALELYRKDPNVEYVEPNYIAHAVELFPNDPMFDQLWALHNTGQTGGTPDADIDAPEAWESGTGSDDIIVAVIDSGIDYGHEDLAANLWKNPGEVVDGVDNDGNGYVDDIYGINVLLPSSYPMDDFGHGTHCAGTIGAVGNNGIGVAGINWNIKMMNLKFLDSYGSGTYGAALECLEYAIIMKEEYGQNIRITSNSWGGQAYSQALRDGFEAAEGADILSVAAAGNMNQNIDGIPMYPAAYDLPSIIAVAATDHNDQLAWFSNYGPISVDLAAPGVDIYSTLPPFAHLSDSCHDDDGDSYGHCSGTSTATPHVAGVAAQVLARGPGQTWDQVKWNVLFSVDSLPALHGITVTGGRVNLTKAMCDPDVVEIRIDSPPPSFGLLPGKQTAIKAWVRTCLPVLGAVVTVDFSNGEPSLVLYDDGIFPDIHAADGQYSAFWTPQILGDLTMTITANAPGFDPTYEEVSGTVADLTADFNASTACGVPPLTIQFSDLSQGDPGIDAWFWDFGDEQTSTEQNPSHQYNEAGAYTVSLTVSYQAVQTTETKHDFIYVATDTDPPLVAAISPHEAPSGAQTSASIVGCNLWPTPSASLYGGGANIKGTFDFPGLVLAVDVRENYAYTTVGGLQIVDISDPEHPSITGACPTQGFGNDVHVAGDYAYVASNEAGLTVVDVRDPTKPFVAARYQTEDRAQGVYVQGDYAYVAFFVYGDPSRLEILDISDPTNPQLVGRRNLVEASPYWSYGVFVSGDYAFIALGDGGLHVVDVIDPSSPQTTGSCVIPEKATDVSVSGSNAFVTSDKAGLQVVDITDPSQPVIVGACDTPRVARGVQIVGNDAYVAGSAYPGGVMDIIDVSNPENPTVVGSCDVSGDAFSVDVSQGYAYVGCAYFAEGKFHVVDVNVRKNPSIAGSWNTPGDAVAVHVTGQHAIIADGSVNNLRILDISDPSIPTGEASLDTGGAFDVYVSGDRAYVANGQNLQVVDISNPETPQIIGEATGANGRVVHASGNYAYTGHSDIDVVDISDPAFPVVASLFRAQVNDLFSSGDYLYSCETRFSRGHFGVIDISDPTRPQVVGECFPGPSSTGGCNGVYVSGDYAYVTCAGDFHSGVYVIEVSDPTPPQEVASCGTPGRAQKVYLSASGDYLYLADQDMGLQVIDIRNPLNPMLVGTCNTPAAAWDVFVSASYPDFVFVADKSAGLQVINAFVPSLDTEWLSQNEITTAISSGFAAGTYDLHVTDPDSGPATLHNAFTVMGAAFSAVPTSGFTPLDVQFTDQSIGTITSWLWDFGDGGTSEEQNQFYTYSGTGEFTVTLTITGPAGQDSETKVDYIHVSQSNVTADFTATPTSGYRPLDVQFTDQSTGTITAWSWDFGDGGSSTDQNPSHTYTTTGDFTVNLTVTGSGGVDTKTRTDCIHVTEAAPIAQFTASPTSGYRPLDVQFTDQSRGTITTWSWDFGDGGSSTDQTPSHTYTTTGDFTVNLTVSGPGGTDAEIKTDYIDVTDSDVIADFTASPTSGNVPLDVQFTDQSTGTITTWSWDFGDGGSSTDQTPSHTYTTTGDFTVNLTVSGPGGTDAEIKTDYIHITEAAPIAQFTASPTSGYRPLDVQFTDQSTGTITAWSWDFGDGGSSTEQNPLYTYTNIGDYSVSLAVSGHGGSDTKTQTDYIHVSDSPPTTIRFGDNTGDDFPGTIEDALIWERNTKANLNFGAKKVNPVGERGTVGPERRSLIRIKNIASNIGAGKTITSAKLYLYCNIEDSSTDYSISAYRVLLDWVEGTLVGAVQYGSSCWNYARYTTLPWNTAGCDAADDGTGEDSTADRRATAEDGTVITGTGQYFSWDLTSAVQQWYSGNWKEYGIILIHDSPDSEGSRKVFPSSENANDGNRPYLEITYHE